MITGTSNLDLRKIEDNWRIDSNFISYSVYSHLLYDCLMRVLLLSYLRNIYHLVDY